MNSPRALVGLRGLSASSNSSYPVRAVIFFLLLFLFLSFFLVGVQSIDWGFRTVKYFFVTHPVSMFFFFFRSECRCVYVSVLLLQFRCGWRILGRVHLPRHSCPIIQHSLKLALHHTSEKRPDCSFRIFLRLCLLTACCTQWIILTGNLPYKMNA